MSRFLILINISWYRLKTLLFQISEDMKLMKMVTVRFIRGDDDKSYAKYGLFVNAWMPLPESYSTDAEKPHIEKPQTNADRIRSMTDDELLDFLCSIETYEQGSVKTIEGGVAMCSVTEVEQWLKAESEG